VLEMYYFNLGLVRTVLRNYKTGSQTNLFF
jgi:hypothetical protein